jgi:hypothetical protein
VAHKSIDTKGFEKILKSEKPPVVQQIPAHKNLINTDGVRGVIQEKIVEPSVIQNSYKESTRENQYKFFDIIVDKPEVYKQKKQLFVLEAPG